MDGRRASQRKSIRAAAFALALLGTARVADGYIGPGAGFTFVTSFLAFFIAFLLGALVFLTAPIRVLIRLFRRRRISAKAKCSRVIVVGLDGMSPVLADRMMREGRLPNLSKLRDTGTFCSLRSTVPSASPVAWSTFQTGTNPGKHNIFDFLRRNPRTYGIDLSSAVVRPPRRVLRLGKYRIPMGRPCVSLLRKSQPFWKVLGEHGIFSIVLRVPITFPPEKFRGVILSGMCVPDLRGSQGSFTCFTTDALGDAEHTGGMRIVVVRDGDEIRSSLPGPPNAVNPSAGVLEAPLSITLHEAAGTAVLRLGGQKLELKLRTYSPWVRLRFHAAPGVNVSGICRFYLSEISPQFRLYVTPINIDPDRPALPISHPFTYASYLAKAFGPYATLGLAEDTWALNEHVIDHDAFIEQAYALHEERETMFFDALEKVDRGLVACVFDITDRASHIFWRFTREAEAAGAPPGDGTYDHTLEEVYERVDEMIGHVRSKLRDDDVLIVMSDHGFGTFHRCVNLNAWLKAHGFLVLKDDADTCGAYFANVDWSRTRAYAVGLGGIFINQAGREARGIVAEGEEKTAVKQAIADGLTGLTDQEKGRTAINRVLDGMEFYKGPYADNGPDLIVGFADGYRTSWDSVIGKCDSVVIEDNKKAWSGDHCVDPDIVPGVLFCNRRINRDRPGIVDIAPTVLDLFGVPVPKYMDGEPLLRVEEQGGGPAGGREEN